MERENASTGTVNGKNPAPLCQSHASTLVLPNLILMACCRLTAVGFEWKKSCTRGNHLNIEPGGAGGRLRDGDQQTVCLQVVQDFFHPPTQDCGFDCFCDTRFGLVCTPRYLSFHPARGVPLEVLADLDARSSSDSESSQVDPTGGLHHYRRCRRCRGRL